jgi:hypothetical protein
MGKISPFLNGWAYKYSRLLFFITNQKYSKKQKEASPADACGVTLFYTRGVD